MTKDNQYSHFGISGRGISKLRGDKPTKQGLSGAKFAISVEIRRDKQTGQKIPFGLSRQRAFFRMTPSFFDDYNNKNDFQMDF